MHISRNIAQVDFYYWILVVLRFGLVLVPQNGYIHPDEFFQSTEVFAGRIFDFAVNVPWEFKVENPIRSNVVNLITIGIPFNALAVLNQLFRSPVTQLITPYILLITPRLIITLLSFVVDHSLYKICTLNREKCGSRMLLLSSSYVMLIFGTRTFSNTIELICFSLLLKFVCESIILSNILVRNHEYLNSRFNQSTSCVDKAIYRKCMRYLPSDFLHHILIISAITVLGVFNRPTFAFYAVIPIFFWLFRGIQSYLTLKAKFYMRTSLLMLLFAPISLLIIVIDSIFYKTLTWAEMGVWKVSIANFVVTPLNFIKYNLDQQNLKNHGLHSKLQHTIVNMPLLYNVLNLQFFEFILRIFNKDRFRGAPNIQNIKLMMMLSILVPLVCLSLIPHQEPRFIIPLLLPIVYVCGPRILPERSMQITKNAQDKKGNSNYDTNILFHVWILLNFGCAVFYGFLHQGGIYPSSVFLERQLKLYPKYTQHVYTSHIYSVPWSFLMVPRRKTSSIVFHEFGSTSLEKMVTSIQNLRNSTNPKTKVYLLQPATLEEKLGYSVAPRNISLKLLKEFHPHFSTEAPPDIHLLMHFNVDAMLKFVKSLSLNIYEVN